MMRPRWSPLEFSRYATRSFVAFFSSALAASADAIVTRKEMKERLCDYLEYLTERMKKAASLG